MELVFLVIELFSSLNEDLREISYGLFLLGAIAGRIVIGYKSATRDWNNNTSGRTRHIGVIADIQYSNAVSSLNYTEGLFMHNQG